MASYTANYNLRKDASTDNYDVAVVNQNLDEIDAQMHQNEVASTTPFTGASSSANGEKGIVPRPMAGDQEKFLRGDGTWAEVQGGGGGGAGADEMTLDEYNALTTAQKNDGTIRFIPQNSSSGTETAVDMSSVNVYKEPSMNVTATSSTETTVTWNGSSSIGCNWNYTTPIDVTNISAITFKVTNGSCYGGGAQAQQTRWDMMVGLMQTPPSSVSVIYPSDTSWAVVADMPLANHVYEETLDVSQLTGSYYIVVCAHGWNSVVEDITLHEGGAYPSQIKYMDKTYGIGGSASSHAYSTTEQIVGTWIDGSDIYERTVVITSAITQGNYVTIISGENIDLLGINSDGCFLTRSNGQRWSIFGGYSGSGLLIYQETNGDIMLYNNSGVDFTDGTITVTYLK